MERTIMEIETWTIALIFIVVIFLKKEQKLRNICYHVWRIMARFKNVIKVYLSFIILKQVYDRRIKNLN